MASSTVALPSAREYVTGGHFGDEDWKPVSEVDELPGDRIEAQVSVSGGKVTSVRAAVVITGEVVPEQDIFYSLTHHDHPRIQICSHAAEPLFEPMFLPDIFSEILTKDGIRSMANQRIFRQL